MGEKFVGEEAIRERVQSELSPRRYMHTVGVVETAERLARIHGVDVKKARIAAWVHDIAREWPKETLLQYAERIEIPAGFAAIPDLLHGPVAAHLLSEWFQIHDEEMKDAIRYHTTGRLSMTPLDMVICLADAIEPGRAYPGVEAIRQRAETDLKGALAESLDSTIRYLLDTHQPVFPLTVMVRNELWEQVQMEVAK
jgi:predicted HD superfamily hydrolase involved in NAD metabolism